MNKYAHLQPYVGRIMKYKDLCQLVGLPPQSGGRNKEMQLKQLKQYMGLERYDGKIIITKIYDDNEISLMEQEGKYTTYIENELINILHHCNQPQISLSYHDIVVKLDMANKRYYQIKHHQDKYIGEFRFDVPLGSEDIISADDVIRQDMSIFFKISEKQYQTIIKNAIMAIHRRGLIICAEGFRLFNSGTGVQHDCTPTEVQDILNIQYALMQEFHVKTKQELLFLPHATTRLFYKKFLDRLKAKTGYDTYAKTFVLTLSDEGLRKEYNKLLCLGRLNENIQHKFLNTSELQCLHQVLLTQFVEKLIKR